LTARVLVAGIGNIFLGDDGFGSAVAQRLLHEPIPDEVKVVDYGISGIHLAYELLEGYETLVLIDALARGGDPGTLYLLEPDFGTGGGFPDAHSMDPRTVLQHARALGAPQTRVLIVGCEPASTQEEIGLSTPVANAIDGAADLVRDVLAGTRGVDAALVSGGG
jgi:hydrogenase maturation protease